MEELHIKRDTAEDELRDAAHDAFMAFWRGMNSAAAGTLWLAYCVAQEEYEAHLMAAMPRSALEQTGAPRSPLD